MNFHTHNQAPINDHLTMLQGSIQATRAQLIAAFGECRQGPSSRVAHDWKIQFADGTVATIYDWNSEPFPEDEPYNWRIGGKAHRAVELVHQAFRKAHDLHARSAA
jgi:hypothetical protein